MKNLPPVVILAGGLATRLGELASNTPKSMITIAGNPFIFYQINQLIIQGIKEIFICLGHLGETVENYVRSKNLFQIKIHFIYDGKNCLGLVVVLEL